MTDFLLQHIAFLAAAIAVLVLPGAATLALVQARQRFFGPVETAVLSVGLSIVVTDAVMIAAGNLAPDAFLPVWVAGLGAWTAACPVVAAVIRRRYGSPAAASRSRISIALPVVLVAVILTKAVYALPQALPVSTDLGHHMYWAERIAIERSLLPYEKRDIVTDPTTGISSITDSAPISDFIVGEHLVFAAVRMLTGRTLVGPMPGMILFLVHVATVAAVYVLVRRLLERSRRGEVVALTATVLYGLLYGLGSPQMKYVLGGVIGNTFGFLLIPSILLLVAVAIRQRSAVLLGTAYAAATGLALIHHLSTLVFVIAVLGMVLVLLVIGRSLLREILRLAVARTAVAVLGGCVAFFLVWPPSYIANRAVTTIVGAPVKEEHTGLSLAQLANLAGEPRLLLAVVGIVALLAAARRHVLAAAVLVGWTVPAVVLVMLPQYTHIDLPSARVAYYLIMPLSVAAAYGAVQLTDILHRRAVPRWLAVTTVALLLLVPVRYGMADDAVYLAKLAPQYATALSVQRTGAFLATQIPADMRIVHDHINIPGDSWFKLQLLQDYNYPFYRANLFRYDRVSDRQERCTLYVIATPSSDEAKRCMAELGIRVLVVNEAIDGQQFRHFRNYWRVYADSGLSVYLYVPKIATTKKQ